MVEIKKRASNGLNQSQKVLEAKPPHAEIDLIILAKPDSDTKFHQLIRDHQ